MYIISYTLIIKQKILEEKLFQCVKVLKSYSPIEQGTGGCMYYSVYVSMLFQQDAVINTAHEISRAHLEGNLWKVVSKMIKRSGPLKLAINPDIQHAFPFKLQPH